jgi:hypothetical protein
MGQLFNIEARGLVTNPNELGAAPGSLSQADNIDIVRDGVYQHPRGFKRLIGNLNGKSLKTRAATVWNGTRIVYYDDLTTPTEGVLAYIDGSGDYQTIMTGLEPPADRSTIVFMQAGECLYWTSSVGVYVLDALGNTPVIAGGLRGLDGVATLTGSPGFMVADEQRSYRILWVVEDDKGNLIRGTPSGRIIVANAYKLVAIAAMSRVGTTVTVSTGAVPHGFSTGWIIDLTPGEANFPAGSKTITVTSTTSFTYTEAGAAVSSTVVQGVALATSTVSLNVPVPTGATVNHLMQAYRTFGSADGETQPDDNHYLVYEANPTSVDLAAGTMTFTDIRPDSLMADALYTNPNQDGIQSANEPPPLAKDINIFKDTAFYANTKSGHYLELNLLSVGGSTGFLAGYSVFFVKGGNTYQFLGRTYSTGVEAAATSTKLGTFRVYTDGTPAQNIYDTANSLVRAINLSSTLGITAFYTSGSNEVPGAMYFENQDLTNTPFSVYTNAVPAAWLPQLPQRLGGINGSTSGLSRTANVTTFGTQYAQSLQVGQSVTVSAYPVRVTACPAGQMSRFGFLVTVTIPAGHDFVTGQVVTSAATVPDVNFSVGVKQITVTGQTTFTYIDTVSGAATSTQDYTFTSGGSAGSFPVGTYTVTGVPSSLSFTYADPGVNATSLNYYYAVVTGTLDKVVSSFDTYVNGLYFSKPGEAFAVPDFNFFKIGDDSEEIMRVVPLRDALFVFKPDGTFRVTDTADGGWLVTPLDSTIRVLAPGAITVGDNQIWALTDQGVMAINDAGGNLVSRVIENTLLQFINTAGADKIYDNAFAVFYESDRKLFMWIPDNATEANDYADFAFVYNSMVGTWVRRDKKARCAVMDPTFNRMLLGYENLMVERKTLTNKDFIDEQTGGENYALSIAGLASDNLSFEYDGSVVPGVGDIVFQPFAYDPDFDSLEEDQYCVVTAVDELEATAYVDRDCGLIVGDANLLKGIEVTMKSNPQHGGDPTSVKQFAEAQLFFGRITVPTQSWCFSTEMSPGFTCQTVTVENPDSDWGLFAWGSAGWGTMASETSVTRLYVPTLKQRGRMLYFKASWQAQAQYAELQGIGIEGRAYGTSTMQSQK